MPNRKPDQETTKDIKRGKNWVLSQEIAAGSNELLKQNFSRLKLEITDTYFKEQADSIFRQLEHWPLSAGSYSSSGLVTKPVQINSEFWLPNVSKFDFIKPDNSIDYHKLSDLTEMLREYPVPGLENDPTMEFRCTHPWFRLMIRGVKRSEFRSLVGQPEKDFDGTWYLLEVERLVQVDISNSAGPQKVQPPKIERYIAKGASKGVPRQWLGYIPFLDGGKPLIVTQGGAKPVK